MARLCRTQEARTAHSLGAPSTCTAGARVRRRRSAANRVHGVGGPGPEPVEPDPDAVGGYAAGRGVPVAEVVVHSGDLTQPNAQHCEKGGQLGGEVVGTWPPGAIDVPRGRRLRPRPQSRRRPGLLAGVGGRRGDGLVCGRRHAGLRSRPEKTAGSGFVEHDVSLTAQVRDVLDKNQPYTVPLWSTENFSRCSCRRWAVVKLQRDTADPSVRAARCPVAVVDVCSAVPLGSRRGSHRQILM